MSFIIHNVEFDTKRDFFKSLGYKGAMSPAQIESQYKGIDNLIRIRLNIVNDSDIELKLKEARDQFYQTVYKNIPEFMPVLVQIYKSAFKSLSQEQQKIIIQTVATLKDLDADDLAKKIAEDLK